MVKIDLLAFLVAIVLHIRNGAQFIENYSRAKPLFPNGHPFFPFGNG